VKIQKLVWLASLVLIVAGAFASIPRLEAIVLVLGLYLGLGIAADTQVRVLVSALVLNTLAHLFDAIPAIGPYLVSIVSNLGVLAAGGAMMICMRNLYGRVKP
jgi:hypothetical protein